MLSNIAIFQGIIWKFQYRDSASLVSPKTMKQHNCF